jgi:hypothetical protein
MASSHFVLLVKLRTQDAILARERHGALTIDTSNTPCSSALETPEYGSSVYLPGRMGAGTTGDGPQTSIVTLRASVCTSHYDLAAACGSNV